jgi:DNA-binding LacI/PurR family transcriptional regulator
VSVSIKDIARAAGVSYSTVSRALNDSPRVNPQTKEQISRLAVEMGYLRSSVARSLVTRRTNTIGVVVTTITDLFFAEVIHAIEETALRHHYSVILANSGGEPDRELAAMRALRERRVDGIILVAGVSQDRAGEPASDPPLVVVNNVHCRHSSYSVEVNNRDGGRTATRYLLELGHRRIAFMAGPVTEWDAIERQAGYEEALLAAGLAVDPALMVYGGSRPKGGLEAMRRLLALPRLPTALFCYNDAAAIGAMRAAHAAGLHIPSDLSVVGFDDIDLAPYFEPPLTTVAQPKHEMGARAVLTVLDLLSGGCPARECVLPSQLVIRESAASPAPGRED